MTDKTLDCTNLPCPQPVIRTKNELETRTDNQLTVIVDNDAACANVTRFAESQGHAVQTSEKEGLFYLRIQKGEDGPVSEPPPISCDVEQKRNMVIYITSEFMGQGSDELGQILMNAYFETISHFATEISHIMLINSGVKLAIEGSEVLEQIRELEKMDIEILVCGTCLNFFKIKNQLGTGTVSNMFTILEALAKTDRVLSP